MENNHRFHVEVGQYAGSDCSGAFSTNTNNIFTQSVTAISPTVAENMIYAQYGGRENCRVIFQGTDF